MPFYTPGNDSCMSLSKPKLSRLFTKNFQEFVFIFPKWFYTISRISKHLASIVQITPDQRCLVKLHDSQIKHTPFLICVYPLFYSVPTPVPMWYEVPLIYHAVTISSKPNWDQVAFIPDWSFLPWSSDYLAARGGQKKEMVEQQVEWLVRVGA